ncbi:MAG TPA: c-type cytochrome domain-containing protein, partial [Pirellulales bacterium]|nr:c-type cytochrome domain-containing protein [Pirellulales bacterium]
MSWKSATFSFSLLSALLIAAPAALAKDPPQAAANEPALLPVAELKHPKPVDFQREILPLLKKNCLACHNATDAEAKLVLETPQTILKGGDNGPAVLPKQGAESLLLVRARGGGDGMMPPEDNKVAAQPLKPEELGLIKLWIDQGATGSVQQTAETIQWQPLPPGVNPVYALALSEDGQYVACGRANQIFIYQVPTGKLVCRLSDPALLKSGIYKQPGVADLDLIQSLAFSPDGLQLASGGYRDVKFWRRPRNVRDLSWADRLPPTVQTLAVSPDGKLLAAAAADNTIKIWNLAHGKEMKSLPGHSNSVTSLVFAPDSKRLVSGALDKTVRVWRLPEGSAAGMIETPAAVQAVALVAGGNQLASGEADGRIRIWDNPANAKPVAIMKSEVTKPDAKMPDTKKDGNAKDAKSKETEVKVPAVKPVRELAGHSKAVTSLATLNKSPTQIVSAGEDGIAILWDAASGKQIRQYKHGGPIAAVAVRPDDQRLATAGRDKIANLWGLGDAKLLAELRGDLRARAHAAALERQVNSAKSIAT